MKHSIYSLLFIFLSFSAASSDITTIDCITNRKTLKPVLNFREVSSLLKPVSSSIDVEYVVDLIDGYYDEEDPVKQSLLLSEIQSLFDTGVINPNSSRFDGGSLLFNIGLNDSEIGDNKVYEVVKAILNYSGEEIVKLNVIDPSLKSAPIHQASAGLNGKVVAILLNYKKKEGYAADPYILDKSEPDTFLGRIPSPVNEDNFAVYREYFAELHKVAPELINLPLMKDGTATFLRQAKASAKMESSLYGTSKIYNGLVLPLKSFGMLEKAEIVPAQKWK